MMETKLTRHVVAARSLLDVRTTAGTFHRRFRDFFCAGFLLFSSGHRLFCFLTLFLFSLLDTLFLFLLFLLDALRVLLACFAGMKRYVMDCAYSKPTLATAKDVAILACVMDLPKVATLGVTGAEVWIATQKASER
jgi:hypothetical protein